MKLAIMRLIRYPSICLKCLRFLSHFIERKLNRKILPDKRATLNQCLKLFENINLLALPNRNFDKLILLLEIGMVRFRFRRIEFAKLSLGVF